MRNRRNLKNSLTTHYSLLATRVKVRSAFTLIELLLYLGLVSIFLTALVYFSWDVILGNVKARVHQEVQENIRFAAHKIQSASRNADGIGDSAFGVNLAANPGAAVSLAGDGPSYPLQVRVEGGVLQIKHGGGIWLSLTSSLVEVTELSFTNLSDTDSENVRFTLTIRHRNPSGKSEWDKEATFETSAQLR
jgi:type II secretory pathway pseudopilin PulG